MSIIKALQEYLWSCPFFVGAKGAISFDRVDAVGDCGLSGRGEETEVQYMDGSQSCCFRALLHLRCSTESNGEREENALWLERLTEWVAAQDAKGDYPVLGEGQRVEAIACQNGRLIDYDETGATAIYQLELLLTYERTKTKGAIT